MNKVEVQYSQKQMTGLFIPSIQLRGKRYIKIKTIFAEVARGGEIITSITSSGVETTNTANTGDYIVQNQTEAKELYIITPEKFVKKYSLIREVKPGMSEYTPKNSPENHILAVQLSAELVSSFHLEKTFQFMAPWGSPQIVHEGDYLVAPLDLSEIYRIGKAEFLETYREIDLKT